MIPSPSAAVDAPSSDEVGFASVSRRALRAIPLQEVLEQAELRRRWRWRPWSQPRRRACWLLIYAPYALVRVPVVGSSDETCAVSSPAGSASAVDCLVCLSSGFAARIDRRSQTFADPRPSDRTRCLSPRLCESEVHHRARDLVLRTAQVLRRGDLNIARHGCRTLEIWQYPYWVEIFERVRERFDLRALDAVSSRPAGAATRRALLEGLIREDPSAPRSAEHI